MVLRKIQYSCSTTSIDSALIAQSFANWSWIVLVQFRKLWKLTGKLKCTLCRSDIVNYRNPACSTISYECKHSILIVNFGFSTAGMYMLYCCKWVSRSTFKNSSYNGLDNGANKTQQGLIQSNKSKQSFGVIAELKQWSPAGCSWDEAYGRKDNFSSVY